MSAKITAAATTNANVITTVHTWHFELIADCGERHGYSRFLSSKLAVELFGYESVGVIARAHLEFVNAVAVACVTIVIAM